MDELNRVIEGLWPVRQDVERGQRDAVRFLYGLAPYVERGLVKEFRPSTSRERAFAALRKK
jgi:hypothetical protein